MWLILALLAPTAWSADPPAAGTAPSTADGATHAEGVRLQTTLRRLAQRNAWEGVEATYSDLLALEVALTYEDHLLGAQAARTLGDLAATRDRLALALSVDPEGDAASELATLDAEFGSVWIEGVAELRPAVAFFRPDQNAAIAHAHEQLVEAGSFRGLLPGGDYTFGDQAFTVTPGGETVFAETGAAPAASRASGDPLGFGFELRMGAGSSSEPLTGSTAATGLYLAGRYDLPKGFDLRAAYRHGWQKQAYLSRHPAPGASAPDRIEQREGWLDARLGVGWTLPGLPEAIDLRAGIEPQFFRLDNASFSSTNGALRLSGGVDLFPTDALVFRGEIAWSPRLFGDAETQSATGLLRYLLNAYVGAGLQVGKGWMLTGGWTLDTLYFEHTARTRHLAVAGVAVTL